MTTHIETSSATENAREETVVRGLEPYIPTLVPFHNNDMAECFVRVHEMALSQPAHVIFERPIEFVDGQWNVVEVMGRD